MKYEVVKTVIDSIHGTKFASIDTTTAVTLLGGKKNPMQGRVTKKTTGSTVILAVSAENVYANMVKKRLVEEGKDFTEFELKPRAWGVRDGDTCFIDHKGKKYLECIFVRSGDSKYYLDDDEIETKDIEGFKETVKENSESQGGLENKVIIRTFDIDSIDEIRINKESYK